MNDVFLSPESCGLRVGFALLSAVCDKYKKLHEERWSGRAPAGEREREMERLSICSAVIYCCLKLWFPISERVCDRESVCDSGWAQCRVLNWMSTALTHA